METLKEALQNYAFLKSWMRPAAVGAPHEFALLGLTTTVCWQVPFSSNASAFAETVQSVQTSGQFRTHCDLDGAFSFAQAELQQPGRSGTLRLVLLYGRSQCAPRLAAAERFGWLLQHPDFYLDALYLHPKQASDNNVQGVFDSITDLEKLVQRVEAPQLASLSPPPAPAKSSYMLEGTALSKVHRVRRPPRRRRAMQRLALTCMLCRCLGCCWRTHINGR